MQALLFEVRPRPGHEDHYFARAAALKPLLASHDGLLFLDRFKSLARPALILSHSRWRDEASIARWRSDKIHYASQAAGRRKHFEDYRIRISTVLSHDDENGETHLYRHSNPYLDPGAKPSRHHIVIASRGAPVGAENAGEAFESVNRENHYLYLADCVDRDEAEAIAAAARGRKDVTGILLCAVSRDYGMFDRAEAPQYFPD